MWCVPANYKLVNSALPWCIDTFGPLYTDGVRTDLWGFGPGTNFGFVKLIGNISVDDTTTYYGFSAEQDAMMFALRWAS